MASQLDMVYQKGLFYLVAQNRSLFDFPREALFQSLTLQAPLTVKLLNANDWQPGCVAQLAGVCLSCGAGYQYSNYACISTSATNTPVQPTNTCPTPPNCKLLEQTCRCKLCYPGYFLFEGQCI